MMNWHPIHSSKFRNMFFSKYSQFLCNLGMLLTFLSNETKIVLQCQLSRRGKKLEFCFILFRLLSKPKMAYSCDAFTSGDKRDRERLTLLSHHESQKNWDKYRL